MPKKIDLPTVERLSLEAPRANLLQHPNLNEKSAKLNANT